MSAHETLDLCANKLQLEFDTVDEFQPELVGLGLFSDDGFIYGFQTTPLIVTIDVPKRRRYRWSVMPNGRGGRQSRFALELSFAQETRVRRDPITPMGALATAEYA